MNETPVPWMLPTRSVGSQEGEHRSVIWFEEWFLVDQILEAPVCTWIRDGNFVKQIPRTSGDLRVWKLTGEWRVSEFSTWQMKAVWPD